jgi:hypothetical protein
MDRPRSALIFDRDLILHESLLEVLGENVGGWSD